MTACFILRLACRFLVGAGVSAAIADLSTLAHFGLRRTAQLCESVRKHVLVSLWWLSSFGCQTELICFVRAAEVAVGTDHPRGLVEHLQLATCLLVPHALHKGLRAA